MPAMRRVLLFVAVLVAACSGGSDTLETETPGVEADASATEPETVDGDADAVDAAPDDAPEPADSDDPAAVPSTTEASSSLPATTVSTTEAPSTTVPATTRPPRTTIGPPTTVATQPTGPAKADSTTPTLAPEDTTDTDGGNAPDTEPSPAYVPPQKGQVQIVNGITYTIVNVPYQMDDGRWWVCELVEYPPPSEVKPRTECGPVGRKTN